MRKKQNSFTEKAVRSRGEFTGEGATVPSPSPKTFAEESKKLHALQWLVISSTEACTGVCMGAKPPNTQTSLPNIMYMCTVLDQIAIIRVQTLTITTTQQNVHVAEIKLHGCRV